LSFVKNGTVKGVLDLGT